MHNILASEGHWVCTELSFRLKLASQRLRSLEVHLYSAPGNVGLIQSTKKSRNKRKIRLTCRTSDEFPEFSDTVSHTLSHGWCERCLSATRNGLVHRQGRSNLRTLNLRKTRLGEDSPQSLSVLRIDGLWISLSRGKDEGLVPPSPSRINRLAI